MSRRMSTFLIFAIFLALTIVAALFTALATILSGCGGGGTGGSALNGLSSNTGTMAVHLVDAPISGVTAVNVLISRVDANINGQWITLDSPNTTYNLLDFQTHDTLLAKAPLPAGTYTQIRLIIPSASVVDDSGTHNVNIPSAAQTGIKLNADITIQPNVITDVLLDFNLDLRDTGDLLQKMGLAKVIDGAKGKFEGRVVWRGSPMSIDYPTLNGRMALNLERGQFLPVDPGLAKLAGVLSLQGLLHFATDLRSGEGVLFRRGDTGTAVRNGARAKLSAASRPAR